MCKLKFFLILFALLFLFIGSAILLAGDSWRQKTPDKWAEDEIHQILSLRLLPGPQSRSAGSDRGAAARIALTVGGTSSFTQTKSEP